MKKTAKEFLKTAIVDTVVTNEGVFYPLESTIKLMDWYQNYKQAVNIKEQFEIVDNADSKRYEFVSKDNKSCSYTVGYDEVSNMEDAIISVWNALKVKLREDCRMQALVGTKYNSWSEMLRDLDLPPREVARLEDVSMETYGSILARQ